MRFLAVALVGMAALLQWLVWPYLPLLPAWMTAPACLLLAGLFVPKTRWMVLGFAPLVLLSIDGADRSRYAAQALTFAMDATLTSAAVWVGVRGRLGPVRPFLHFAAVHGLFLVGLRLAQMVWPAGIVVLLFLVPVCAAGMWQRPLSRDLVAT